MLSTSHEFRNNKVGLTKRITSGSSRAPRKRNAENELSNLQSLQHTHDENYHQDIWCLPFNARIKHMVLHFAKYTGKFLLAEENQDASLFGPTVVDAWIITLASANMLNLKLASALDLDSATKADLLSVGQALLASHFASARNPYLLAIHEIGKITGRMAKACESLDHMEAFDSRETLERGALDMAKLCLALAASLDFDLIPLVHARWKEVESKSIF